MNNLFKNYSETYSAGILSLAGLIASVLVLFHINIAQADIQFILGLIANLTGVIWSLYHRKSKGDINVLGKRI